MKVYKEYDAKLDMRKRITIRNAKGDYYHVRELDGGIIMLEPREFMPPFQISMRTLSMMDKSIKSLKAGEASFPIDVSEFAD